jgi:hypothetical protein
MISGGAIPTELRSAKNYHTEFDSPRGKLEGTATYLATGAMVFSLPTMDEGAFLGSGMTLWTIDNPMLDASFARRLGWIDAVSAFTFHMHASNASQTLPIVVAATAKQPQGNDQKQPEFPHVTNAHRRG